MGWVEWSGKTTLKTKKAKVTQDPGKEEYQTADIPRYHTPKGQEGGPPREVREKREESVEVMGGWGGEQEDITQATPTRSGAWVHGGAML